MFPRTTLLKIAGYHILASRLPKQITLRRWTKTIPNSTVKWTFGRPKTKGNFPKIGLSLKWAQWMRGRDAFQPWSCSTTGETHMKAFILTPQWTFSRTLSAQTSLLRRGEFAKDAVFPMFTCSNRPFFGSQWDQLRIWRLATCCWPPLNIFTRIRIWNRIVFWSKLDFPGPKLQDLVQIVPGYYKRLGKYFGTPFKLVANSPK